MTTNEALDIIVNRGYNEGGAYIAENWRNAIKEVSDAYVNGRLAEIVHCKDCKKQFTSDCLLMFFGMRKLDNWFCADGVKRDGE